MMSSRETSVRERILDAAVALLRSHGVKALSQTRVAKEAGVQQGHLTYYFPRRGDLVAAIAERFVESMNSEVQSLLSSGAYFQGHSAMREGLHDVIAAIVRDHERTRMLMALMIEAERDPAIRPVMAQQAASMRALMAYWLNRPASDPEVQLSLGLLWGLAVEQLVWQETRGTDESDTLVHRALTWIDTLAIRESSNLDSERTSGTVSPVAVAQGATISPAVSNAATNTRR
jgi:AcrR family transcriptional regulator